jgi:hypothetical protein
MDIQSFGGLSTGKETKGVELQEKEAQGVKPQ